MAAALAQMVLWGRSGVLKKQYSHEMSLRPALVAARVVRSAASNVLKREAGGFEPGLLLMGIMTGSGLLDKYLICTWR